MQLWIWLVFQTLVSNNLSCVINTTHMCWSLSIKLHNTITVIGMVLTCMSYLGNARWQHIYFILYFTSHPTICSQLLPAIRAHTHTFWQNIWSCLEQDIIVVTWHLTALSPLPATTNHSIVNELHKMICGVNYLPSCCHCVQLIWFTCIVNICYHSVFSITYVVFNLLIMSRVEPLIRDIILISIQL